jgi:branched-chain amino acid transport system permease protein
VSVRIAGLKYRLGGAWRPVVRAGLLGALAAIYLSVVGIVPVFHGRIALIAGVVSLGQGAILASLLLAGYLAARSARDIPRMLLNAGLAGLVAGGALSLLVVVGSAINLRTVLLHASDPLYNLLTLDRGVEAGFWVPALGGTLLGVLAGGIAALPRSVQRSLAAGVLSVVVIGLFAALLRTPLLASPFAPLGRLLFGPEGLTLYGAAVALVGALGAGIGSGVGGRMGGARGGAVGGVAGGIVLGLIGGLVGGDLSGTLGLPRPDAGALGALIGGSLGVGIGAALGASLEQGIRRARVEERYSRLPATQQTVVALTLRILLITLALSIILPLPLALGPFFAHVVAIVALYILMGLGLNITLGLAGLLDLGFVAFFAVGAYTVGLLTSTGPLGIAGWPFWAAIPFAVLIAFIFGAFLGLPILGIRGDYLAIATLGFGEIINRLANSDLLARWLGGPQGIVSIPKPIAAAPGDPLAGPNQIYYIALACAAVIAFFAYRLRDSRIGRAWVAIREDEDVAEALGINLVQTKLLAYALGAAFAGLGGAIFAGLIGSIFAASINLFVSINVAALIIVGGMGSIPGVVVGAIFLIGLPELFREFDEYRFLFYGAALVLMMRFRPEGLLPSKVAQRELHVEEEDVEASGAGVGATVAQREG